MFDRALFRDFLHRLLKEDEELQALICSIVPQKRTPAPPPCPDILTPDMLEGALRGGFADLTSSIQELGQKVADLSAIIQEGQDTQELHVRAARRVLLTLLPYVESTLAGIPPSPDLVRETMIGVRETLVFFEDELPEDEPFEDELPEDEPFEVYTEEDDMAAPSSPPQNDLAVSDGDDGAELAGEDLVPDDADDNVNELSEE